MPTSIYDFRDTDLLAKLQSQGGSGALAHELADEMGINGDHGAQSIGIRLAWMKKFGMLNYDEKTKMWTITPGAERVLESHVRAAATRQIEDIPDEAMVEVMSHVTARYRLAANSQDALVATMLRREFQYGTSRRSRAWR